MLLLRLGSTLFVGSAGRGGGGVRREAERMKAIALGCVNGVRVAKLYGLSGS